MKNIKRITGLFIFTAGVILFWLVPGINQAGEERYTRIYEDTDKSAAGTSAVSGPRKPKDKSKAKRQAIASKKKYKKESIKAGAKFSDVKLSMFSRAIHFEREPEIALDPIEQLPLATDTTKEILITEKIELP